MNLSIFINYHQFDGTYYVSFSPSLPALDWQLPSCSGPYNLQIEVQPKSHHRAHYETEGSRGAVKALSGGHPVVQVCRTQKQSFYSHSRQFFFFFTQAKVIFVCLACVIIFCHYSISGNTQTEAVRFLTAPFSCLAAKWTF